MAFPKFTKEVKNISKLPDVPAVSADQLKEKFDKAAVDIQTFLNDSLIEELEKADKENVKKEEGMGLSKNSFTDDEKENVRENTDARHIHENKKALDEITEEEKNKLLNIPSDFNYNAALTFAKLVAGLGIKIEEQDGKAVFTVTGGGDGGVSLEYLNMLLEGKADVIDVLTKDNAEEYNPTADYHPATVKFVDEKVNERAYKPASFVTGNLAVFDEYGNPADSGSKPDDFADATEFSNHSGNKDIHVTEEQKDKWNGKADKAQIVEYEADTDVSIIIDSASKIHKAGTIPSLQLLVSTGSDYSIEPTVYSVSFVSGSTATTFTAPETFVFSGDGCEDGVFVPEASTSYEMIGMWNYDTLRWVVKAW